MMNEWTEQEWYSKCYEWMDWTGMIISVRWKNGLNSNMIKNGRNKNDHLIVIKNGLNSRHVVGS